MPTIDFTTMRALLTAVIAAIEAAAVALAVFAVIGIPAVLVWWLSFDLGAEPEALASVIAALWQMVHLVPMQLTVSPQAALGMGLPAAELSRDAKSLAARPASAPAAMDEALDRGWGKGLIRSWNAEGWHMLPVTVGDRLAPMMGASPGEVLVADSTSINLSKIFCAAMRLRPGRANAARARSTSARMAQSSAWSLTRPMACMKAYTVVGPTNFQPRFL